MGWLRRRGGGFHGGAGVWSALRTEGSEPLGSGPLVLLPMLLGRKPQQSKPRVSVRRWGLVEGRRWGLVEGQRWGLVEGRRWGLVEGQRHHVLFMVFGSFAEK